MAMFNSKLFVYRQGMLPGPPCQSPPRARRAAAQLFRTAKGGRGGRHGGSAAKGTAAAARIGEGQRKVWVNYGYLVAYPTE